MNLLKKIRALFRPAESVDKNLSGLQKPELPSTHYNQGLFQDDQSRYLDAIARKRENNIRSRAGPWQQK